MFSYSFTYNASRIILFCSIGNTIYCSILKLCPSKIFLHRIINNYRWSFKRISQFSDFKLQQIILYNICLCFGSGSWDLLSAFEISYTTFKTQGTGTCFGLVNVLDPDPVCQSRIRNPADRMFSSVCPSFPPSATLSPLSGDLCCYSPAAAHYL